MPFECPTDHIPEQFDSAAPGNFHMQLTSVDEDGGNDGSMICDFEVLAGSVDGQEGKTHREYFTKTLKSLSRVHALAVALGMVTSDQLKAMKSAGQSPVYDFPAQVGKQLCMGLATETNPNNQKQSIKCGFRMFHPADPIVATWPKNAAMLARAGIVLPTPPAAGSLGIKL